MGKKNGFSKKKIIIGTAVTVLVTSISLYILAYRYLIERKESPASTITNSSVISKISTDQTKEKNDAKYDDWNYKSDSKEIKIKKIEEGTGKDKVTYFVADVKLKDSRSLNSAFAKDTFGRNITETTSKIAEDNRAIFAINGDYYGFRGDGVVIRNSTLYRDIPTRTGAAFYSDGKLQTFDEKNVSSSELIKNGVTNTLSFGPILINDGTVISNFSNIKIDDNFGNRSIDEDNPRTGVGMIEPNHFVFVVVDGRMENYSKGMSLLEFTKVFENLGCTEAYNLDGGGSSTMYFMGRVVNNPLGQGAERKISDILYIK